MEDSRPQLQFTQRWQEAIVGHMLANYPFFLNCKEYMQAGWFEHPNLQILFQIIINAYDALENKRMVTPSEIEGKVAGLYHKVAEANALNATMQICIASSKDVGLDFIAPDLTAWIRIAKLKNAFYAGEALFNQKKYDEAGRVVKEKLHDMLRTEFAPPPEASFKDPITFFRNRTEELKDCLTFGHWEVDEMLRKGSAKPVLPGMDTSWQLDLRNRTVGSLPKGDSTVLIGPTNAGKTTTCVTVVSHNVKMERSVLYITMEQKERDIMTKLYQAYQAMDGTKLSSIETNQEVGQKMGLAAYAYDKYLTYISYIDPTKMYVEDLLELVNQKQERRIATTGKGYDLMVIDYPGMLGSRSQMNRKSSGWEEVSYVYRQMYMAARYMNCHGIFPMQTNREGYRINKGDSNEFIDNDNVSQGFNVTHGADNVITINRSPNDEQKGIMHFYVSKSRLGPKAWSFTTETAFAKSLTHGPTLKMKIGDATKSKAAEHADTILQTRHENPLKGTIDDLRQNAIAQEQNLVNPDVIKTVEAPVDLDEQDSGEMHDDMLNSGIGRSPHES